MFSGFETWSKVFFCTLSGRPVNSVWLLPVTQSERHHYKPLIDQLMDFYKKNDQFPFAVYEWTKFSPGLMGRWLELLKTSVVVKSIKDITTIPMMDVTKSKVQNNPLFFAEYWKECFDLINTKDILELRCMQKYEEEGVYLLMSHSKGFLNPFVIIHPDIVQYYPTSERKVFERILDAFTGETWNSNAKGKSLEVMIAGALELRQIHSTGLLEFSTIVSALCGQNKSSKDVLVTNAKVRYRKSVAI